MAFIDGDVDRPIIIGAVPNPATPSPVVEDEPLHHRIQTASGIKIEFEDAF
jgi:type VI secretion system secreted protein VgrG